MALINQSPISASGAPSACFPVTILWSMFSNVHGTMKTKATFALTKPYWHAALQRKKQA